MTEWYWAESENAEQWNGPHDTRQGALDAGRSDMMADYKTNGPFIGVGKRPDPADFIPDDMDDLLERMDDNADDWYADGPLFVVRDEDRATAAAALQHALKEWAETYVSADFASVWPEGEARGARR